MSNLYSGATIKLSMNRIVNIQDCSGCQKLMVRVDKQRLSDDDVILLEELGLRMAAENSRRDICEICEEEKREKKLLEKRQV